MLEAAHREIYKKHVIEIANDEFAEDVNPRTNCSNLGVMALFHKRYKLGDENHGLRTEDFFGWDEMQSHIREDSVVVLPVYMYDHSGITISTSPFSCPWDSGQIGFIFARRADVLKEFNRKRVSKKLLAEVTKMLQSEVKEYDSFLRGEVYGYRIFPVNPEFPDDPDEIDRASELESCWGYIGEYDAKNGVLDIAKNLVDNLVTA